MRKTGQRLRIKSKHSVNRWDRNYNSTILLILICLASFGCAQKPWTNPLDEKQTENTIQFLESLSSKTESCPKGIDGNISLFYQNLFDKKSVRGYFQFLSPSFIKIIVSNPLGQPLLAITSDQRSFQAINTLEGRYTTGRVSSYGLLHNIPVVLLRGNWQNWIRGAISVDPSTITAIRQDREDRGTWVTVEKESDDKRQKTHLLIEPKEGTLLSRIVESDAGELFAEITYGGWVSIGKCKQPHMIKVSGLEFNTELAIKLSGVLIAENLNKDDFRLTAPVSYVRQVLP